MSAASVAIAGHLVAGGAAFHLGGRLLVAARRDPEGAQDRMFGIWALLAGALLLINAAVVASLGGDSGQLEVLLLARTIVIAAVLVHGIVAVSELANLPVPRLIVLLALVTSVLRVGLYAFTDLVYTHTVDAAGLPVFGPWVLPSALPMMALAAGFAVLLAQGWNQPRDRHVMSVAAVAALGTVLPGFMIPESVLAEALFGAWVLPVLVGGEIVSSRRAFRLRDERRRLARHRDQLTAEVARTNEQLREALALRDDILSAASHELRTPLTPMTGLLELLQQRLPQLPPDQVREHLQVIERNALRLRSLIDDLLAAVSTRGASSAVGDPRPVDVRDVLVQVAGSGERPRASVSSPPDLLVVADPNHLEALLARLLDNARVYGAPPIELRARPVDSSVEIRVVDHGPGVPEDLVPRLFEPFMQASRGNRRTAQGVGLGLAIARATAESWRGALNYEPTEHGGSSFVLTLPAPARAVAAGRGR